MTDSPAKAHLYRLDETRWSYCIPHQETGPEDRLEEICIQIPQFSRGIEAHELLSTVVSVFENHRPMLTQSLFRKGVRFQIQVPETHSEITWEITARKSSSFLCRIFNSAVGKALQFDPFTRHIQKQRSVSVNVRKVPQTYLGAIIHSIFGITLSNVSATNAPATLSQSPSLPLILDEARRIHFHSFRDPFTHLASRCFKKLELFFTMEREHRGSYRFIVEEGPTIRLIEDIVPAEEEALRRYQEENRTAVRTYRDFFRTEYGECIYAHTEYSFDIHFDSMIEQGLPLYPDHVSKCNIGANNIEIHILERLWKRLVLMNEDLQRLASDPARWEQVRSRPAAEYMAHIKGTVPFSIRSLRGIFRSIPLVSSGDREPSVADLHDFVSRFVGDRMISSVRDLPRTTFNTLVDFVMPSDRERRKSLTGRQIRHLSIMGYHTMGEPNTPNPCRDLFELVHLFPDLQKEEDWKNYFELLSHVVVKKSLVRDTPVPAGEKERRHVGFLLPAPQSASGEKRWYCTDAYCNDGQGNVNYVLLPACADYRSNDSRPLPLIKLYRSTASNRNAESWQDSLAADLNPHGAPGSLRPDLSFEYERHHFEERTIPLWMGHLIYALLVKGWMGKESPRDKRRAEHFASTYRRHLLAAANLSIQYLHHHHPDAVSSELHTCLAHDDLESIERLLKEYGLRFREDPRFKIAQDLALVGHSLGGALAQAGTYIFSAKTGRMPLPGHQFICYSSDGPAIDNWKDAEFMQFGQRHRELFEALHVRWNLYHQFEYGDFIPEAGGSHLGTTGYCPWQDIQWIKDGITVFRPLRTAQALSIVAAPTHGRRIGTAVLERDYTVTKISPLDLQEYDHSWWLSHRIGRIWGYRFFNSPRTSELVRKNVSRLIALPLRLFNYCVRREVKDSDAQGVSWQKNTMGSPVPEYSTI